MKDCDAYFKYFMKFPAGLLKNELTRPVGTQEAMDIALPAELKKAADRIYKLK